MGEGRLARLGAAVTKMFGAEGPAADQTLSGKCYVYDAQVIDQDGEVLGTRLVYVGGEVIVGNPIPKEELREIGLVYSSHEAMREDISRNFEGSQ